VVQSFNLIADIYNAFDPFRPLEPGDPFYVVCNTMRGNDNVLWELGRKIERSNQATCQLYTGHRGVGKSTELKRLKADLESKGCRVVYFAVDDDIDETDAQYTDILLACTRHVLEELRDQANPSLLTQWLESRWQSLKDLALTEIKFGDMQLETQISQFAKLTATLRQVPSTRQTIREQVDIHSVSLLDALNEFIVEAKRKLGSKLVVIVDNLDRILPMPRSEGRSNHDEIFLDHSGQLRRLDCHVIYTVPISLVYSNRAAALRDSYGDYQVVPMLMVKRRDGQDFPVGLEKVKELISQRVNQFASDLNLDTEIFDQAETVTRLCRMSGGHMREVMQLMQTACDWTDSLPIPVSAVQRAITRARDNYRNTVDEIDWQKLAEVSVRKLVPNDGDYRKLLFNRCVLEYREIDQNGDMICWHDVHPLIENIPEFQQAKNKLPSP
jgi:AAA ATPase domain